MGKAIARRVAALGLDRHALVGVLADLARTSREDLADIMPACTPLSQPGERGYLVVSEDEAVDPRSRSLWRRPESRSYGSASGF